MLVLAAVLGAVQAAAQDDRLAWVSLIDRVLKIEASSPGGRLQIGSGVVVDNQIIVTNCHVTRAASRISVVRAGERVDVELQVSDVAHDLCLLKVPGMQGTPLPIASAAALRQGDELVALGYTGGAGVQVSRGTVVSLHRWSGSNVIQSSTGFTSGASGGGLFTRGGALVGILTFRLRGSRLHYYAAPADWLREQLGRPYTDVHPQGGRTFWEEAGATQPAFLKAAALEQSGQWAELAQVAGKWSSDQADDPEPPYLLGVAHEEMNDVDAALHSLRHSIEIDPDYGRSWTRLVALYQRLGRLMEARHALAVLTIRDPRLGRELSQALDLGTVERPR
jgi:hypothetical protein